LNKTEQWVVVCRADEIEEEDVIRFDHGGATYAIYRTDKGYFASDGYCTHEKAHLADGLVIGDVIECSFHNGRFHIPTGKPLKPPVCVALRTHPVRVEEGQVLLRVPGA
jgi:3-phenylpropionate/trans-cinnamate dioxygenase ferredoxin subunit